jgi:hypothetical protein
VYALKFLELQENKTLWILKSSTSWHKFAKRRLCFKQSFFRRCYKIAPRHWTFFKYPQNEASACIGAGVLTYFSKNAQWCEIAPLLTTLFTPIYYRYAFFFCQTICCGRPCVGGLRLKH